MISINNDIKARNIISAMMKKTISIFDLGNNYGETHWIQKNKTYFSNLKSFFFVSASDSASAFAKVNLRFRTEEDLPGLCKLFLLFFVSEKFSLLRTPITTLEQ